MKRSIYSVLAFGLMACFANVAFGQALRLDEHPRPVKPMYSDYYNQAALGKGTVNEWFAPRVLMADYGAQFSGPGYFPLFQDSSVFFIPSADAQDQSPYSNGFNVFGTVFQATDPLYAISLDAGETFGRFDAFQVDSLGFPYSYIRQADSVMINGEMREVVDTAFVHYYKNENINTGWFFNNSDEIFAIPFGDNFRRNLLTGNDVEYIDTVLLTADAATDSMLEESINLGFITVGVPSNIGQVSSDPSLEENNVIGFSIAFKTMIPYSFGDTLLSYNDNVVPTKKMNIFGTTSYGNTGARVIQTDYNNNSFVVNRQVLYGQSLGSLKGYIPTIQSIGWARDFYFSGMFKLSGDVSSVADKSEVTVSVYPNPATSGSTITVVAGNLADAAATVTVTDLQGRVMFNGSADANGTVVSTEGFTSGLYLVTVESNGVSSTQKVMIAR